MKKLLSLVLTLTLALALCVPAGAAETASAKEPSSVGVVLNGKALTLSGAQAELKNGQTMVPLRALVEAMGGTVSAQGGELVCQLAGQSDAIRLRPGADSYYKNGGTYVSLRSVADAMGYDLLWDSASRSAALVDRSALIAELDKNFTVLNAALKKVQSDPSKNYQSTVNYDILLDIPADAAAATPAMKMTLKMKLNMISSATKVEMSGSVDASALAKLLELDQAVESGALSATQAAALNKSLSNVTFEVLFDVETMTYYMSCPLLSTLSNGQIPAETWMKLSLQDLMDLSGAGSLLDMAALTKDTQTTPTVGNLIYAFSYLQAKASGTGGALYQDALDAGSLAAAFLGDSAAKQNGSAYQFHFGITELEKLTGEEELKALFETFSMDLTVSGGTITATFDVKLAKDSEMPTMPQMALSGSVSMTATTAKLNMLLDMGTAGKAQYVMDIVMQPTTQQPKTEPPAGAQVMDLNELLAGMLSGMSEGAVPDIAA